MQEEQLSIKPDSGFFKGYIRKVNMLDLSQKSQNIRLRIMSEKSLCQMYAKSGCNYARIKLESHYARILLDRFKLCQI